MKPVATSGYGSRMSPNQPKHPTRPIRVDLTEWDDFGKAAKVNGTDRSAALRAFMQWYISKPGVRSPKRPERSQWEAPATEADEQEGGK